MARDLFQDRRWVSGLIEEEGSKDNKEDESHGQADEVSEEDNPQSEEQKDVFDEDEKDLFNKLMKKIQDAGDLEKDLESDFESFEQRVESVIDSVDRIENLERSSIEDLVYKQVGTVEEETAGTSSEDDSTREKIDKPPEPGVEKEGTEEEGDTEIEKAPTPYDSPVDGMPGQVYLPADKPYEEVKKGEVKFDYKGEFLDAYGTEVETILGKMLKLITIKIDKNELENAKNLFMVSANIGGGSRIFQNEFIPIADILDIKVPEDRFMRDGKSVRPTSIDDYDETEVLDPDLAEEIGVLQKKASSALKQLDSLINSSELSSEEIKKMKLQFVKSMELYREKRFHKAYEVALETLESIKNKVADGIDTRIQSDLYKTRELLEDYSKKEGSKDTKKVEELNTTLDRAMKAYLTNEFEKATLLTKKVMNTILDIRGEGGGELKKKADDLKKELRELKELNLPTREIDHMMEAVRSAENFIDRRDNKNAEKIFARIKDSIEELREKSNKYVSAKELEIKLNNRMERLDISGPELESLRKKFDFVGKYFKEERYDDILVVGKEIENEIDRLEEFVKDTESKEILEELKDLMGRVEEFEDADLYKRTYEGIVEAGKKGDIAYLKSMGRELIETLTGKYKTVGVIRARRIARSVVEGRMLMTKLQSLSIDTTKFDRDLRKSRSHLKEGNFAKGLELMEDINDRMKKTYADKMEYIRDFTNIYRDSLEVLMDRHKDEPIVYFIKKKQVPILRKLAELGNFNKALEHYRELESRFTDVIISEDKKDSVESELNDIKFEIYKRKEEGMDITEPLSIYTQAQKRYNEGQVVPAEFLIEVSRRYCETFMPT
ncbi:MAG: hypothetical protein ACMUHY_01960 [Thermoplasmatota archaeon]